ncbi:flagellar basal body P-ring formation protein FlgA [Rhizobiales bacterium]|uniref:flagellar basal body P-ring formation chaperone FlgA n=1 Tax=Hongsoonwoonella zoysiae TaxID=2821844 RepID=UPI0015619182|nr:flagellar basal body P-ring formation chaperone FlgA [Hongsoonwoonella zoysiae]NRG18016.1 flagellar basal body P-ring formation protein FlgA [Hongsoonwoonella zoysiae]
MLIRLAAFAVSSALGFTGALADAPLRSEVVVTRDIVTVGDFYPDAGRFADTPLFRAPDLGTSGSVPASVVADRARDAGYEQAAADGLIRVHVRRDAIRIDAHHIEEEIRRELVLRAPHLKASTLELSLSGFSGPRLADPAAVEPLAIESLTWDEEAGRLDAVVAISTGTARETFRLRGRAVELVEVYAPAARIDRGAVISRGDLTAVKLPRNRVNERMITDPEEAVGLAAKRRLRASAPLLSGDLQPPVLVERGDKVTLVYKVPGMTLTAQGQAIAQGGKGDVVDIINLQSRRTISATVVSRGRVVVDAGFQRTASLEGAR